MPTDIPAILASLPLFRELSADELASIAAHAREVRVARGETVFQRGTPSSGFHVVAHGQIKLAIAIASGAEKVVEIIGPRQSFGEAVMFLEKPYPVYAQALADSLLLHIARQDVFDEIEREPRFARKLLAGLSIRLHGLIQDVENYSLRSAAERVIGYLLQHEAGDDGRVCLPAAKHVIASRLNLTPETFSRVLHDLAAAGLVEVDGKHLCIPDPQKLRAHVA